ncbi:MAG: threonine synthase [Clostridiales bacterium]|nr:threonine synthase [Clostridiales bacterium]
MEYISTRNNKISASSSYCLLKGISEDGGLFVPESFPQFSLAQIAAMGELSYAERALSVLSAFLTDFSQEELESCVKNAYMSGSFHSPEVAPLSRLSETESVLELWHGPTLAFKDMALQLLPHLLTTAKKKQGEQSEIMILVATSGDTGKAALEGFADVEGVRITVFYPEEGVSHTQKLQMVTQRGDNVVVGAIEGNFDDAQTGVKQIFSDKEFNELLLRHGVKLSSANSINWGRLVPQIVYYFSAYADLCKCGRIELGDEVNFVVPTGNFGNILAAYYAKLMGLPVHKLICASNCNNVLTDFIQTGTYNAKRPFHKTISPSMDILISSNLERLLFHLTGNDDRITAELMNSLKQNGSYTVSPELMEKLHETFVGGYATEEQTVQTIHDAYARFGYIMDTHTAVAQSVYDRYAEQTGDQTVTVVVSTASAHKFPVDVVRAIDGRELDELDAAAALEDLGLEQPDEVRYLYMKPVLHDLVCKKDELKSVILASVIG